MNRFAKILFWIIFAELTIGGGGRLFVLGPLTLRMVLFGMAMIVSVVYLIKRKPLSDETRQILIFFTIITGLAIAIGAINEADPKFWWEDVKPLLYFLMLPFFEWVVDDEKTIRNALSIIKVSAIIQSFVFLTVLILIHSGVIPFLDFYYFVLPTQEFFFRGEITFFYKGFLFVCIAFIIVYLTNEKHRRILLALLLLVVCLTLTRGFFLALFLTLFVYHLKSSNRLRATILATLAVCVLIFSQPVIHHVSKVVDRMIKSNSGSPNEKLLGDRGHSDAGRIAQIKEVISMTSVSSCFIGNGFGVGIPSRPVHMEISYLEIFHKQGFAGLAFWGLLLWLLWQRFRACSPSPLADVLFFSAIFVFFQSMTNQFMNNPIGLSVILFSFVSLRVLKE
jgi:hypothetical protein